MTFSTSLIAMTYLALTAGFGGENSESIQQLTTITTRAGVKYTGVEVRRVQPNAVVFFHDGGAANLPLKDLTPELQEFFDYEPVRAAEAARAEEAKQWEIRRRMAAELAAWHAAEAERIRAWEEQQTKIEIAKLEALTARYAYETSLQNSSPASYDTSGVYGLSYPYGYGYGYGDRGFYAAPFRQSVSSSQCDRPHPAPVQIDRRPSSHHHSSGGSAIQRGAKVSAPAIAPRSHQGGARQ